MRHQTLGKTQVSVRLSIATLATLLFVLAFGLQAPVYADDPDEADPVEDCFGGALSADPLHCHVLEEAHNAGIIEVDAIYGVARGLFIYLTQDDSLGSDSLDYLRRTAQEEARRTGEHECVLDPYGCGSGVLSTGKGYVLPESSVLSRHPALTGGCRSEAVLWRVASFSRVVAGGRCWCRRVRWGTRERCFRRFGRRCDQLSGAEGELRRGHGWQRHL